MLDVHSYSSSLRKLIIHVNNVMIFRQVASKFDISTINFGICCLQMKINLWVKYTRHASEKQTLIYCKINGESFWHPSLHWRHNDHDGVSNHQPHGCLFNRLFRRRSKKTSKLRVIGHCARNSPGPVNSPRKGVVTRKMFPFGDVIMYKWQVIKIFFHLNPWRWIMGCYVITWQEYDWTAIHTLAYIVLFLVCVSISETNCMELCDITLDSNQKQCW